MFARNQGFKLRSVHVCWVFLFVLTGCQWIGLEDRVTPQVVGRVLNAETHQPIAGVTVQPVVPGRTPAEDFSEKGAERLMRGRPVMTDASGKFVFPSKGYVTFLKSSSWWSCTLSFQQPGYAALQTNFTVTKVSSSATQGRAVVEAGDIYLQPLSK